MSTWRERGAREQRAAKDASSLPREPAGHFARSALAISILGWCAVFATAIALLPQRVPTHWSFYADAGGAVPADGWSSKTGALSLMGMAFMGVVAMLFISRIVIRAPAAVNARNKEWWMAKGSRLVRYERLLREDLMLIVAATVGLLACIQGQIIIASSTVDGATHRWVFWVLLGLYLGVIGVIVTRMVRGDRYAEYDDPPTA